MQASSAGTTRADGCAGRLSPAEPEAEPAGRLLTKTVLLKNASVVGLIPTRAAFTRDKWRSGVADPEKKAQALDIGEAECIQLYI